MWVCMVLLAIPLCLAQEWAYTGSNGPAHWASDFPDCGLDAQSPILLPSGDWIPDEGIPLEGISFADRSTRGVLQNTGETLRFTLDPSSGNTVSGARLVGSFEVQQLHFHAPTEHKFAGEAHHPLEMHVVCYNEVDAVYAVVAIVFTIGASNDFVDQFAVPLEGGAGGTDLEGVNMEWLTSTTEDAAYFSYYGSFTTPPCTEIVQWIVLKNHPTVAQGQLDSIKAAWSGANNRPIMPLNGRAVRLWDPARGTLRAVEGTDEPPPDEGDNRRPDDEVVFHHADVAPSGRHPITTAFRSGIYTTLGVGILCFLGVTGMLCMAISGRLPDYYNRNVL